MNNNKEHRLKYIISNRFDGLGGRLSNLLYSMALAELFGINFLVHWPDSSDLSGKSIHVLFSDERFAFWQSQKKRSHDSGALDHDHSGHLLKTETLYKTDEFKKVLFVSHKDILHKDDIYKNDVVVLRTKNIESISYLGFTQRQIEQRCRAIFETIQINENISSVLNKFELELDIRNRIGIHVRQQGLENHRLAYHQKRFVTEKQFLESLTLYDSSQLYFIATDNPEIKNVIPVEAKNRCAFLPTPGFGRSKAIDLQYAFTEMLLLSKCSEIVSGISQFSQCAALIGNKPLRLL